MIQKLLKVGSSAAVTIPKKSLKELGLEIGDEVTVDVDIANERVTIGPSKKRPAEIIDWANSFIEKYRLALKALAKK
ncbi:MAG: AbrB/MazE/SpoVT family DNA-binding domain-containing protein [Candidatus Vogelbacteria bacterium]|nr:AbrB/MazE/SpoVT family DNA-binding domain-containing protein [Candidatus Vogelbacteria bacterium]